MADQSANRASAMKRSRRVSLRLVPIAAAAFLAACEGTDQKTCVDQNGRVVADSNCAAPAAGTSWNGHGSSGYDHWYRYRGSAPVMGSHPPFGGRFAGSGSTATARGGFGATAAGHAGGGAG
jgi:hypothetical protein